MESALINLLTSPQQLAQLMLMDDHSAWCWESSAVTGTCSWRHSTLSEMAPLKLTKQVVESE